MQNKLTVSDAKVHIPRLVLSQHVHKDIHGDSLAGRINTRLAVRITKMVGSMWCAYIFALIALVSFPAAIRSHNPLIIVTWIAQTFLQLVLLPIIKLWAKMSKPPLVMRARRATIKHFWPSIP